MYVLQQVLFDAPYNRQATEPRITHWKDWRSVIYPLLGKAESLPPYMDFDIDSNCSVAGTDSTSSGDLMASLSLSRVRDRATSDALLAGYQIPTMNMPPSSRPIGMLKLRRDTSHNSDTAPSQHSLNVGMNAKDIQRGVDMLQMGAEPLSPEDLATIHSASVSLMQDDADLLSDDGGSAHGSARGGSFSMGAAAGTRSHSVGDAAASEARTKAQRTLTEQAAKRQEDHGREVEESQRKEALDRDETDTEGLQIFRSAYNFWKRTTAAAPKKATP